MTRRGSLLVWIVFGAVTVSAGAVAMRALPNGPKLVLLGAAALGLFVLAGAIGLSLHFAKRQRESRERGVDRVDATLRVMAGQDSDTYVEGGVYQHPMIGSIHYPGRIRGRRGALRFELSIQEDEDGAGLVVTVGPVAGKKGRLTPRTRNLSPEVRQRVEELSLVCERIALEAPGPSVLGADSPPRQGELHLVSTGSGQLELLTPERLRVVLERAIALANQLSRA